MRKFVSLLVAGLLFALAACQPAAPQPVEPSPAPAQTEADAPKAADPTEAPASVATLTVMTHDSFAVSKEIVEKFETENNVKVNFVKGGDTGKALNTLVLSAVSGNPPADIFYGLDNSFLSLALDKGLFESYEAPALAKVDAQFKLDPANGALPIDYGDVCINYDKAYFKEKNIPVPSKLEELVDPTYSGMLVVENPATSSPGLSFVMATIAKWGPDQAQTWWASMKENGLVVVNDWETAYYTNFSGSSGKGNQPLVVSYASSPAAELIYGDPKPEEAPTGSIVEDGACWRQIEFAGILKGTKNRAMAEKFIDFMLSEAFQADMPLQMFVYPVVDGVQLPEDFIRASEVPTVPATLDPATIAKERANIIETWTKLIGK